MKTIVRLFIKKLQKMQEPQLQKRLGIVNMNTSKVFLLKIGIMNDFARVKL